jgi:indolepyruvate ferredoxin oxidoreductase alpha subunit
VTPLLNMVHNGSNVTLMVLDNSTTAMTGHQDHPGTENTLEGKGKRVDIEKLVRAIGVEHVLKANAFDVKSVDAAIKEGLNHEGLSFIIVEGPCFFVGKNTKPAFTVTQDCNGCGTCSKLGCSAIARSEIVDEKTEGRISMIRCVCG